MLLIKVLPRSDRTSGSNCSHQMTEWQHEKKGQRKEREREGEREGVLGEDKHSWGSQLLNNSERDSQHSVQRRSTVRSAHSLQRRVGGGKRRRLFRVRERGGVYKDDGRGRHDCGRDCLCVHAYVHLCVAPCTVCVFKRVCQLRMCDPLCVCHDENRQCEGETGCILLERSGFSESPWQPPPPSILHSCLLCLHSAIQPFLPPTLFWLPSSFSLLIHSIPLYLLLFTPPLIIHIMFLLLPKPDFQHDLSSQHVAICT